MPRLRPPYTLYKAAHSRVDLLKVAKEFRFLLLNGNIAVMMTAAVLRQSLTTFRKAWAASDTWAALTGLYGGLRQTRLYMYMSANVNSLDGLNLLPKSDAPMLEGVKCLSPMHE